MTIRTIYGYIKDKYLYDLTNNDVYYVGFDIDNYGQPCRYYNVKKNDSDVWVIYKVL